MRERGREGERERGRDGFYNNLERIISYVANN
jgi:hypothetical protein